MISNPAISVVMAVFNTNETYLRFAIDSILEQTFQDFEFIIVLDAPSDHSPDIIAAYAKKDHRIHIVINEINIGLTRSLNKGITIAKGKYIARMDSDDFSVPERFEREYRFLENNPDVGVVGGHAYAYLPTKKVRIITGWCNNDDETKARMLFYNAGVPHPTAMFRRIMPDGFIVQYDETIKKSQDYALWGECIQRARIVLLPQVLLIYRVHDEQISADSNSQNLYACEVMYRQIDKFYNARNRERYQCYAKLFHSDETVPPRDLKRYFGELVEINKAKQVIKQRTFIRMLKTIRIENLYAKRIRTKVWLSEIAKENIDLLTPTAIYDFIRIYFGSRFIHDAICHVYAKRHQELIKRVLLINSLDRIPVLE